MAIQVEINASVKTVTWTFPSGPVVTLHHERLSVKNQVYAALHGLKQKAGDCMALKAEDFPGNRVPESAKLSALKGMVEFLESGAESWNPLRATRESQPSNIRYLLPALGEIYPKRDLAYLTEFLKAKSKEDQLALSLRPNIKSVIDRMAAEAVSHIDTDEMLEGLEAEGDSDIEPELETEADLDAAIAREMAGN